MAGKIKKKRSKRSLKQDRKKIALKQKHEVAYMRKIAREVIKEIENYCPPRGGVVCYSPTKIRRLARAFIKATNKR